MTVQLLPPTILQWLFFCELRSCHLFGLHAAPPTDTDALSVQALTVRVFSLMTACGLQKVQIPSVQIHLIFCYCCLCSALLTRLSCDAAGRSCDRANVEMLLCVSAIRLQCRLSALLVILLQWCVRGVFHAPLGRRLRSDNGNLLEPCTVFKIITYDIAQELLEYCWLAKTMPE